MAVSIILCSYVSGYKYSNIVTTVINLLDDLTTKHFYFMWSMPPCVGRIKIFDKDNQTTKACLMFCSLGIFIRKLDSIS